MKFLNKGTILSLSAASLLVGCFGSACTAPASNGGANLANSSLTNSNSMLNSNVNSMNMNSANANMNMSGSTDSAIDAKEPEQYQATVMLRLATSGAQNLALPPIRAEVARSGADRRMAFTLPNGQNVVYLDKAGRQLVIVPQQKQYAELNQDSLGFEVRRLMMPEQIVNQLKNMKGIEQVGEETVDGRDAIKYRLATSTNTQTQAGKVDTETFILVDKETGLPLRSVTNSAAQGNVQGINGLNFVTEINNIRTDVDPNLFAVPTDMKQVAPEQIRQQVNAVFSAAMAIIGQLMKSAQPAASATPMTTTTP